MGITLPIHAVFAEAVVGEDGALHLKDADRFTLKPGERVVLTISPIEEPSHTDHKPLLGTVTHYEDPFGPATVLDEWEALQEC